MSDLREDQENYHRRVSGYGLGQFQLDLLRVSSAGANPTRMDQLRIVLGIKSGRPYGPS